MSRYDRWLREEFDSAAPEYAARLERNPVERRFRIRSVELLQSTFPTPGRLLELGSGTGLETIPMLAAGHRVLAVDVSEGMLTELRANALRAGTATNLSTRRLRARDLGALIDGQTEGSFDGGFSTFGALNLEPDLGVVADALGRLLRPGAPFVAGVFGRHAWAEPLVALAEGHPGRALARLERPAPVGSHRFSVDTYLRTVAELRRAFGAGFVLRRVVGFGLVLPPPSFADRLGRWGTNWDRVDRWDRRLGSLPPLAEFADQFVAVFQRVASTP